jgi:hypothetical protein
MSRNSREHTTRRALAARMSLQFDHALSEAAEVLEACGAGCNDSGADAIVGPVEGVDSVPGVAGGSDLAGGDGLGDDFAEGPGVEEVPLERQLADLELAVATILEQRDRVLYGYGETSGEDSRDATGSDSGRPVDDPAAAASVRER